MGELRADGIGVNEFQVREYVLELGALRDGIVAAAGEELGVEVGIGEPEVFQIEHIGLGALLHPQRIELRDQVAPVRVHLDEAGDRALLGASAAGFAGRRGARGRRQLQPGPPGAHEWRVRDFAGATPSGGRSTRPRRGSTAPGSFRNFSYRSSMKSAFPPESAVVANWSARDWLMSASVGENLKNINMMRARRVRTQTLSLAQGATIWNVMPSGKITR